MPEGAPLGAKALMTVPCFARYYSPRLMKILWYKTNGFATDNYIRWDCRHLTGEMPHCSSATPGEGCRRGGTSFSMTGRREEYL
jgi:hypothetical protein